MPAALIASEAVDEHSGHVGMVLYGLACRSPGFRAIGFWALGFRVTAVAILIVLGSWASVCVSFYGVWGWGLCPYIEDSQNLQPIGREPQNPSVYHAEKLKFIPETERRLQQSRTSAKLLP